MRKIIKEKQTTLNIALEKLINIFEELSTGDFWLKNQQNLLLINELFEENFKSN